MIEGVWVEVCEDKALTATMAYIVRCIMNFVISATWKWLNAGVLLDFVGSYKLSIVEYDRFGCWCRPES